MRWKTSAVGTALLLLAAVSASAQEATRVKVELDPETNRKTIEDRIEGYETFDYIVPGEAGQSLKVAFRSKMWGAYINIYPPDSDAPMHIGGNLGNRFEGILPETGEYRVHVFLMDNAADLDQVAEFTIQFALSNSNAASQDQDEPDAPEIFVRASGEIEVSFESGCDALYGSDGTKITAGASCSGEELREADEAVEAHRR